MGNILIACCECGFQSDEINFGCGMMHDEYTTYAPCICPNCNELLLKDYEYKNPSKVHSIKLKFSGEILLRYLIPGLVYFDRGEIIRFSVCVALAIWGLIWIATIDNFDGVAIGMIILLLAWIPSIIKTSKHYISRQLKEKMDKAHLCLKWETKVIYYNHPFLQKDCENTRKKKKNGILSTTNYIVEISGYQNEVLLP